MISMTTASGEPSMPSSSSSSSPLPASVKNKTTSPSYASSPLSPDGGIIESSEDSIPSQPSTGLELYNSHTFSESLPTVQSDTKTENITLSVQNISSTQDISVGNVGEIKSVIPSPSSAFSTVIAVLPSSQANVNGHVPVPSGPGKRSDLANTPTQSAVPQTRSQPPAWSVPSSHNMSPPSAPVPSNPGHTSQHPGPPAAVSAPSTGGRFPPPPLSSHSAGLGSRQQVPMSTVVMVTRPAGDQKPDAPTSPIHR